MPVATAARASSSSAAAMRSKASRVTWAEGVAPAQIDGSGCQPRSAASRRKPPIGSEVGAMRASIAAPRVLSG